MIEVDKDWLFSAQMGPLDKNNKQFFTSLFFFVEQPKTRLNSYSEQFKSKNKKIYN